MADDRLAALIAKWGENYAYICTRTMTDYTRGERDALDVCISQLQEALSAAPQPDRLAALVAEWRERIEALRRDGGWAARHRWDVYDVCASALEEALSSAAPAPGDDNPAIHPPHRVLFSGIAPVVSHTKGQPKPPAPCPECGGKREVSESGSGLTGAWKVRVPCPRCSAQPAALPPEIMEQVQKVNEAARKTFDPQDQPAPSDVVMVPRDVVEEYVSADAAVDDPIGKGDELRLITDRYYTAREALNKALAAALRQGGGG